MKRLSRTDYLIPKLKDFLVTQGILREGNENVFLNTAPYTTQIPVPYGGNFKLFYCLALSICIPSQDVLPGYSNDIEFANSKILSRSSVNYVHLNRNLYIYRVFNEFLTILTRFKIEKVKILGVELNSLEIDAKECDSRRGVYAIFLRGETGISLSIAFSEPVIVDVMRQKIDIFIPKSDLIIISTTVYTKVFRDVLVYKGLGEAMGKLRNTQPIAEILDPIVMGFVDDIDKGCIDMILTNPENIDLNSIIKVYGYIDELIVDDLAKFKPKQNIVRIAIPSYSKSRVRLCISTYIPKRYDMYLRLDLSSKPFNSSK